MIPWSFQHGAFSLGLPWFAAGVCFVGFIGGYSLGIGVSVLWLEKLRGWSCKKLAGSGFRVGCGFCRPLAGAQLHPPILICRKIPTRALEYISPTVSMARYLKRRYRNPTVTPNPATTARYGPLNLTPQASTRQLHVRITIKGNQGTPYLQALRGIAGVPIRSPRVRLQILYPNPSNR